MRFVPRFDLDVERYSPSLFVRPVASFLDEHFLDMGFLKNGYAEFPEVRPSYMIDVS
jgi:hypothetical protein